MKKLLTLLMALLLTVSTCGCTRKGNNTTPTPTPKPNNNNNNNAQPVKVDYYETILSDERSIEKLLKDFNDNNGKGWTAFRADKKGDDNWYTVWESDKVYAGNVDQYLNNGEVPLTDWTITYKDNRIYELTAYFPTSAIDETTEEEAAVLYDLEFKLLRVLLPDLGDKKLGELMFYIAVADEGTYAAYRHKQSTASEFVESSYRIKEKFTDKMFRIANEYDPKGNTIKLTFKPE